MGAETPKTSLRPEFGWRPKPAGIVVAVIATLALGAAGGYFWQNRAVRSLTDARDTAIQEGADLKTKLTALDSQTKSLQAEKTKLEKQLETMTAERNALSDAVQVSSGSRDLADAYGRAAVKGNQVWMRALMTPELAAAHTFRAVLPDMAPSRYAIVKEGKDGTAQTYTVRVWQKFQGVSEIGSFDDTLTVAKVGDVYKIQAIKLADYISLQMGK